MPEEEAKKILDQTLKSFSKRHRNIKRIFKDNFDQIVKTTEFKNDFSLEQKLLIGSYFTMEYLKSDFCLKLKEIGTYDLVSKILDNLLDEFTFEELKEAIHIFRKK